MPDNAIKILIDGTQAPTEVELADWQAEVFSLDGLSRSAAGSGALERLLGAEEVLELELANGVRILTSGDDLDRYLGPAKDRGTTGSPAIAVGQSLRPGGGRPPAGLSRDGLGAWLLKGLRIYHQGPAAMTALAAAGTFQDAQLEDRNGLYRCSSDRFGLTRAEALAASPEPSLLLIHGTASSTEGSFGDLWRNERYRKELERLYGSRIYAFEHRSLTESPVANALDVVRTLPKGARLHVVSHSRGGMVGELLARANRLGGEPFGEDEIQRFLDHASRTGRKGFENDAKRLRQLNTELRNRAIRVERFVRVACPARGTTLASGKLDRWASVMLNLLGKGFDAAGKLVPGALPLVKGYGILKTFLLAVVKERCDATVLPGLEAMMPDSPLVSLLNAPDVELDPPLHVLAGDFVGEGLLPWLGDCISEVFYGSETDLVVNTPSMSGGAARKQGIRQKPVSGPQVNHFTYFARDESAFALFAALQGDDSQYQPLAGPSRTTISRGGKKPFPKQDAPIVFMLPGTMGSHIQLGGNRIWFDPAGMIAGEMEQLKIGATGVTPDGWLDQSYEKLAFHLTSTHEVRPFAYDWRISIVDEATRFAKELKDGMADARKRGQPVRIIAHSMGGLVARLALKDLWAEFKAIPGSRLVQLGTPNNGSHSIAAVLMARDDFIQNIERWCDWKHDMREFLEIVRDYPGVLELLPWPVANGRALDGVDYFDPKVWDAWYAEDSDSAKGRSWLTPQGPILGAAAQAIARIQAAPLDPDCVIYVAGRASTPSAVRVVDGNVEIGWVDEGDGRVLWQTGIPPGVPTWYVNAVHGDLANHEPAFEAYSELLVMGTTRDPALSRSPSATRGTGGPVFRPRKLQGNALYPSADEVLAAATGSSRPGRRTPKSEPPATIEVVHGSIASADSPVLIGAYANDSLRGSAKFLDSRLGGQLQRTHDLGRYPAQSDDAMVFLNTERNGKPGGAIVVGLGTIGDLTPGKLTEALSNGLLEFVRCHEQCRESPPGDALPVSGLLVGTGFTGLCVEAGARCMVEALSRANRALADAKIGAKQRISCLTIYEDAEDRAIAAVLALKKYACDPRYSQSVRFDGQLRKGVGGFRGRSVASGGEPGGYRALIVKDESGAGGLRFTIITDRARNEVVAEPDQRQAVDGLIASVTGDTQDQRGLSRALFELMVPNGMKPLVGEIASLMMSVDAEAGSYPWELMRDSDNPEAAPLAVRVEVVRQLASAHGRGKVPTVTDNRVFVVGDTRSDLPPLPGAQAEAEAVAKLFAAADYAVDPLYRARPVQVLEGLFCGKYRFMHLAGHGVVKDEATGQTGMVIGPRTFLTPAQVNKLRHVPELVFINCCHLGSTTEDANPRWGELAANLGTQFIEMGCKAVIAAGWAVDDDAASDFAQTFYQTMLRGERFGEAVLAARAATYRQHGQSNTWGAFQAYGDEHYRFPDSVSDGEKAPIYVHASQAIADIEMIAARLPGASDADKEACRRRIEAIEAAVRGPISARADVLEELADVWAELDDKARAIDLYRAALEAEDGSVSLRAVEQLANLEIRHGAKLGEAKAKADRKAGEHYMRSGYDRLQTLLAIGRTSERLSLVASYWKRLATMALQQNRGHAKALASARTAYWEAAEHNHQATGDWDYYPLFNALDCDLLLVAQGERSVFDKQMGRALALVKAGRENASRRFTDNRLFFHALAQVEADRIDALLACFDGRSDQSLSKPAMRDELIARYRDLLARLASPRETDSALGQIKFLAAQFQPLAGQNKRAKEIGKALEAMIRHISA